MRLSVEHHKTILIESTEAEKLELVRANRVWYTDYQQKLQCFGLFQYKDSSFSTGYLDTVLKKLEKKGIKPEVVDTRKYIGPYLSFQKKNTSPPLWDNQVRLQKAIEANNTGIVSSFTGSGKSVSMLEAFMYRRVKTLIIVPSITIQKQLFKTFSDAIGSKLVTMKAPKFFTSAPANTSGTVPVEIKKKMGSDYAASFATSAANKPKAKMGSSYFEDSKESNTFAPKKKMGSSYLENFAPPTKLEPEKEYLSRKMSPEKIQKWQKRQLEKKHNLYKKQKEIPVTILCFQGMDEVPEDYLKTVECVIIDECHHASAKTIREVLLKMPNACYRYGFSATPYRDKYHEEMLLISALGSKEIFDFSAKEAVEKGIIAKPKFEMIQSPTPDGKYLANIKHWRTILEDGIIGNKTRNKAIVYRAVELIENGHNVLVCVDEIAHLEILQQRLKDNKVEAYVIHGQMKGSDKDENVKIVSDTTTGIVSLATMAVGEGANLVNVDVVILAGGGKGSIRFLQRIGRGIRKTSTKDTMLVVDFEDWFNPTLARHSRARRKIFKETFGE